jgi:very-short-patch-repair endonuclease
MNTRGKRYEYQKADPTTYRCFEAFAREHRKEPTEAENCLWQAIRNRQVAGAKFRRQHVIDRYIVDFICLEARLIIEVDGPIHQHGEQPMLDEIRTQKLATLGYRMLRFTNEDVLTALRIVLKKIREELHNDQTREMVHRIRKCHRGAPLPGRGAGGEAYPRSFRNLRSRKPSPRKKAVYPSAYHSWVASSGPPVFIIDFSVSTGKA